MVACSHHKLDHAKLPGEGTGEDFDLVVWYSYD
jgi:hypothetical protein